MYSNTTVIKAEGLSKFFGDLKAVDDVSFSIDRGEVIGYLGPNGSGKTTIIRMLLGLLIPNAGKASVLGFDSTTETEKVRERVGYMSQKFTLYHDLTVEENLRFYAGVYEVKSSARIKEILELLGLAENKKVLAGSLSVGWRQRLALGTAIIHEPEILFLDEPTSGVDPTARRDFWELIYLLADEGVTAFVTTHYMDEAEYCGRVGIMRKGKLLALDSPSRLKETIISETMWDVYGESQIDVLRALDNCDFVVRTGLVSDHMRAVTTQETRIDHLLQVLDSTGIEGVKIRKVTPTLEDVFLALA